MTTHICWVPGCGRTDVRRFINYWACPKHAPERTRARHGSLWAVSSGDMCQAKPLRPV